MFGQARCGILRTGEYIGKTWEGIGVDTENNMLDWWCEVSIRICHADLDPAQLSEALKSTAQITQRPGESPVPHGNSRSAGYWCLSHRIDAPDHPGATLLWAEDFVKGREVELRKLLEQGVDVNVYIGVFSKILALGFDLPPTPTISKLGIRLGIEFFSK